MFNIRLILTLLNIDNMGRGTINNLLKNNLPQSLDEHSILSFLEENKNKIKRMPKVDISSIINAKYKCENIIKRCEEENIKIITILDEEFPTKLKIIKDNPVIIYYKGNLNCITNNKAIALIGRRSPSLLSQQLSYDFAEILVKNNFTVVSGLALGCDTFAHQGAINNKGCTVAVMPCGLDIIYPGSNKKLYEEILINKGCIISEYAPGQHIYKNQFIERDRLQSALSLGVIAIETTSKGGSMHTINFASNQNKLVACYKCETNNHLLKRKDMYFIYDTKSLEKFLNMTEINLKEKSMEEKHTQLKFIL